MAAAANNASNILNIDSYLVEKAGERLKKRPKTVNKISATLQDTLTKEYLRDLSEKDVNKFFENGKTPLTEAISREFVRKSISCDPESNEYEYENDNKNDIVSILIAKGADVNKVDRFRDPVSKMANFSPLAMAIFNVSSGSLYKCVILDLFKAGATLDKTAQRELIEAKKAGEDDLYNYVMYLTAGRMHYNIKKAKHNLKRFHSEGPMGENVSEYFGGRRKTLRNKRSKSKKRAITRRLR
jgi:hypothetical protein